MLAEKVHTRAGHQAPALDLNASAGPVAREQHVARRPQLDGYTPDGAVCFSCSREYYETLITNYDIK